MKCYTIISMPIMMIVTRSFISNSTFGTMFNNTFQ